MSETKLWKILKKNKKYVGQVLAEEDKKYRLQKLEEEISTLKTRQATLQSEKVKTIHTKVELSKLSWSPAHKKKIIEKLKQDPKVAPKKSLISLMESIVDSFF